MEAQNNQEKGRISASIQQTTSSSTPLVKLYLIIVASLFLISLMTVVYMKPNLIFRSRTRSKQWRLASIYPPNISPRYDLPQILPNLAICTRDNLKTRRALQHQFRQHTILKSRAYKLHWAVHEYEDILWYSRHQKQPTMKNATRIPTAEIFESAPRHVQEDFLLVEWLQAGRIQGILPFNISWERALSSFYNYVTVRHHNSSSNLTMLFSSLMLLQNPRTSKVPSQWWDWLLENAHLPEYREESVYRRALQQELSRWISDDSRVEWTVWDALCQGDEPPAFPLDSSRKLATMCLSDQSCCDIYDLTTRIDRAHQDDDENIDGSSLRH